MVKAQIGFNQIRRAAQKLSAQKRLKLIEELRETTWQEEFRQLVTKIRSRAKKHPISDAEIDAMVEEVREENYVKRRH